MMKIFKYLSIFFLLILIAFFLTFNISKKQFVKNNYEDPNLWNILIYNKIINMNVNDQFIAHYYIKNNQSGFKAHFKTNNFGMWSENNYKLKKEKNEYRILILGGEQSASSVVDISWPDFLEKKLNLKTKKKNIYYKVINCGWPDAGPKHYIDYWLKRDLKINMIYGCKNFNPDLVIVDFPETDFNRIDLQGGLSGLSYRSKNVSDLFLIDYRGFKSWVRATKDSINKKEFVKFTDSNIFPNSESLDLYSDKNALRDMNIIASRPFGMFADKDLILDKAEVEKLQNELVKDLIFSVTSNKMIMFEYHFYNVLNFLSFGSIGDIDQKINVHKIRNYDPSPVEMKIPENIFVEKTLENFQWLNKNIENIIFFHNFNYPQIRDNMKFHYTEELLNLDDSINIIDSRSLINKKINDDELQSWFLYPYMNEKMSIKGHSIYADIISNYLIENRGF